MAKIRILKRQNNAYIELPHEMSNYEEVELFQLKEGYYLLSVPLGQEGKSNNQEINDVERALLKKMLSIRFENRTPAYVNKTLTEQELVVLKELERKGLVNVFKGNKYKDGVYNIRDSIYPLLAQNTSSSKTVPPHPPTQHPSDTSGLLNSRGFLVISDKNEARVLSERLNQEMKSGAVVGVKGFDGKFYIVTRTYFSKAQTSISSVLKSDMDADAIALASKLDPEGCKAVLHLMADNGEIIEKRKGIFAAV